MVNIGFGKGRGIELEGRPIKNGLLHSEYAGHDELEHSEKWHRYGCAGAQAILLT